MKWFENLKKLYNPLIVFLAIVSVILAAIDFSRGLNQWERVLDLAIYTLFIADYGIRFVLANSKLDFVKNNIIDLIAIFPFNSALRMLRALRILRFGRLLRFTRLLRVGSVTARGVNRFAKFFDTNGFKYILVLVTVALFLSTFSMVHFENMTTHDALWWSFVTITTVGYGDISPVTLAGRITAITLMLVGIGLIGALSSTITSFFIQEKKDAKKKFEADYQMKTRDNHATSLLNKYQQLTPEGKEKLHERMDELVALGFVEPSMKED